MKRIIFRIYDTFTKKVGIWRTIFNKPKFTYQEYINGPKRKNYYDEMGHEFNNRIIAFIVIGIVVCLLVNYYP